MISLDDRLMYRFAYYNDAVGGKQHWYVNHSVRASSAQLEVRWVRKFQAPQIAIMPSALLHGPFQSGTWAPDANWRWMGSIAADRNNDILVGYSLSNTTVNPVNRSCRSIAIHSVRYSGAGNLSAHAGTGSPTQL